LPLALVLMKPEYDVWAPGEHNGTFRGHCPAFVTAAAALNYWQDDMLRHAVESKGRLVEQRLKRMAKTLGVDAKVRGRGLIYGIEFPDAQVAGRVSQACFKRGLIIETAGIDDQVLKLLPSLTIQEAELKRGLDIIEESAREVLLGQAAGAMFVAA
jgi:diaminobutyrate-2-oxoglutarate transaminase